MTTVETPTTAQLADQQRRLQATIRAAAIREFLTLARNWNGDKNSFANLIKATIVLVRARYPLSAAAGVSFYEAVRKAEGVAGLATPRLAADINVEQVVKSMYATGEAAVRNALQGGRSAAEARTAAITRMSGAVTRLVADGGRDSVLQSVQADPHARGWARITDGNPCYFCLTLASRGAIYKSDETASFEAHDHCGCTAIPVYDGTVIPNLERWQEIYDAAQNHGEASGLLQQGENSSKARLNAVRQYLAAAAA